MDFKIFKSGSGNNNLVLEKASATVIEAGDFVTLDAGGLAIKAIAASTALAYAEEPAGDGTLEITVNNDPELILSGTGDAVFAKSMRGTEVDLVGTTTLLIDVGLSVTDVLKILPSENAGTVGSTDEILVRINKTL